MKQLFNVNLPLVEDISKRLMDVFSVFKQRICTEL